MSGRPPRRALGGPDPDPGEASGSGTAVSLCWPLEIAEAVATWLAPGPTGMPKSELLDQAHADLTYRIAYTKGGSHTYDGGDEPDVDPYADPFDAA